MRYCLCTALCVSVCYASRLSGDDRHGRNTPHDIIGMNTLNGISIISQIVQRCSPVFQMFSIVLFSYHSDCTHVYSTFNDWLLHQSLFITVASLTLSLNHAFTNTMFLYSIYTIVSICILFQGGIEWPDLKHHEKKKTVGADYTNLTSYDANC